MLEHWPSLVPSEQSVLPALQSPLVWQVLPLLGQPHWLHFLIRSIPAQNIGLVAEQVPVGVASLQVPPPLLEQDEASTKKTIMSKHIHSVILFMVWFCYGNV
jgi:hypothetical protein